MTPYELVKSLNEQQKALNELTLGSIFLNKAAGDMLQHITHGCGTDIIQEDAHVYEQALKALANGIELFEKASRPMREIG